MNSFISKDAFQGKRVVISGGCGDIGLEIARRFEAAGESNSFSQVSQQTPSMELLFLLMAAQDWFQLR